MPPQTADGAAALHGEWRGVSAATVVPGSPSSYTQYDRTCSHLRAPTFPLSSRVFGALSQRLPGADGSPSLVDNLSVKSCVKRITTSPIFAPVTQAARRDNLFSGTLCCMFLQSTLIVDSQSAFRCFGSLVDSDVMH